ncbi:MAG: LAGLIDADG family homing endonuclease [Nanoarchaeota archaeon]
MIFNILQFLPNNARIKLENGAPDLFNYKNLTDLGKIFNIPIKNMSRYRNGTRTLSLDLFKKLIKFSNTDVKKFQDKISIKIGRSGSFLKIGPYIEIDSKWVYISQLINGDGHITSNLWYTTFVNQDEVLIKYVHSFFVNLGLPKDSFDLIKRSDASFLIIRSSLISVILSKILELDVGKKNMIHLPKFIFKDKQLKIAAVRGAFDAEGCVSFSGTRRISITSNSDIWIKQLKEILEDLNIKSRIFVDTNNKEKPLYRLLITHIINITRFFEIIKPIHSKRSKKLEQIIQSFNRNYKGKFHKDILLAIDKGISRKRNIANYLNQNLILINNNLNWLKKNDFIFAKDQIITNKGCFFIYALTDKGKTYLQNGSDSFFN